MNIRMAGLLAFLPLAAMAAEPAQKPGLAMPGLRVTEAWISEAPPVARNNAAYVTITGGAHKDSLLGVETSVAVRTEMHEMSMTGDLMRMRQLPQVSVAAGAAVRFAPGGQHLMLIDMKRPLKVGEKVPLTLRFRRAGRITVQAEVRPLVPQAATDPHAHHH